MLFQEASERGATEIEPTIGSTGNCLFSQVSYSLQFKIHRLCSLNYPTPLQCVLMAQELVRRAEDQEVPSSSPTQD